MAPFSRDSGKMRGKRAIWAGRAALRACLYMAAVAAARGANPAVAGFYRRLRQAGKPAEGFTWVTLGLADGHKRA